MADVLNHLQPPQTRMPIAADDDVIMHLDPEAARIIDDALRYLDAHSRRRGGLLGDDCAPG